MSKRYHVYGVGAALVDTEINVSDDDLVRMGVEKGLMTLVDKERQKYLFDCLTPDLVHSKRTSGGSTGNAIIAIAQFGGETFYSCKVGSDDDGEFYLRDLQTAGVHCHKDKRHNEGSTGTCLVMITPDAERTLCTFLGINANLSEDDIDEEIIAAAEYVYFEAYMAMSPISLAAAIHIRKIAKQNNVKTALSFSDSGVVKDFRDSLREILSEPIDLLFCNLNEALSWTEAKNIEDAIDSLKKIAHTFAITLGADGALVYDGIKLHNIAPYKVQSVDTSGAGDMFAGAFLFGITQGKDFPTAGNLSSFAAATVVSNYGARLDVTKQQEILLQWNNSSEK